ncbi:cupredoxin domain-containing protein [Microbulbifer hainanensis]|uniref:cupredoxin domain-containing protein n=1 Tax=Microbulbifer hainanensis TaxID=2735675 RepID=UPI001D018F49|nr:cupredoxin domain-containing protein [Microbulbifer hainanensis]
MIRGLMTAAILTLAATASNAMAEVKEFKIVIKDHMFEPAKLVVPAGEKVKLLVINQDATPEEFESYDLYREKVVAGNSQIVIFLDPMDPGEYSYFGEFHEATAQGKIIAQ